MTPIEVSVHFQVTRTGVEGLCITSTSVVAGWDNEISHRIACPVGEGQRTRLVKGLEVDQAPLAIYGQVGDIVESTDTLPGVVGGSNNDEICCESGE